MNVASGSFGAVLLVAGLTVGTPAADPLPRTGFLGIELTASDEPDIVIDFVRHAQTSPSGDVVSNATQGLPGYPLSETGQQQADALGPQLFGEFGGPHGVAGIFGGQEQRMIETIAPFDKLEDMTMQTLGATPQDAGGFDEIGGGIYSDGLTHSLGEYLDALPPLLWILGADFAWLPGGNDYNGAEFEQNFGGAVDAMYQQTALDVAHPVVSANGHITDVVVSGAGAITTWVAMNVQNPDLALVIPIAIGALSSQNLVDNAGQVVVQGNPTDGWTLVSWDGQAFPTDPGLLTDLFVDVRGLLTAPQSAVWDVFEAAVNGQAVVDGTALPFDDALKQGLDSVGTAVVKFPESVIADVVGAVQTLGADVAGGESLGDAFGSAILGLT